MSEHDGDEGPEGEMLAGVEVGGGDGFGLEAEVSVEDFLDHGEHVGGGEDDSGGGEGGPGGVVVAGTCMEPERTRNSPTKPLSMGRPMTESVVMTKRVTIQGSLRGEAAVARACRRCRSARRGGRAG